MSPIVHIGGQGGRGRGGGLLAPETKSPQGGHYARGDVSRQGPGYSKVPNKRPVCLFRTFCYFKRERQYRLFLFE